MQDDQWRHEKRIDMELTPEDKARFDVSTFEPVWFIQHRGIAAFFTETDVIEIVSLNRHSAMR